LKYKASGGIMKTAQKTDYCSLYIFGEW